MSAGLTLRPSDAAILRALADGPLTAQEIAESIRREAQEAWSEKRGYHFEWGSDSEPLGARLLAHCDARDQGLVLLAHEVDSRLRSLERRGLVGRIQVDGQRPMLWQLRPVVRGGGQEPGGDA